jgi:Lon protease-like protein
MNSKIDIPLFPLAVVLLPHLSMPLHIFEERYKLMIKECLEKELEFGVVYWKDSGIRRIGCSARIADVLWRYEDGRLDILTVGTNRFLTTSLDESRPFLRASVRFFEDDVEKPKTRLLQRSMKALELLKTVNPLADNEEYPNPLLGTDLSLLSFFIAGHDAFNFDERQELLEMTSPSARIEKEIEWLEKKIQSLKTQEEIRKIQGGNGKMRNKL